MRDKWLTHTHTYILQTNTGTILFGYIYMTPTASPCYILYICIVYLFYILYNIYKEW